MHVIINYGMDALYTAYVHAHAHAHVQAKINYVEIILLT